MSTQHRSGRPAAPPRASSSTKASTQRISRQRRTSSLGADPRGDTAAPALATTNLPNIDRPTSPVHPRGKERGRKRKKARNALRRYARLCIKHTWVLPLTIVLILLAAYVAYPGEQNPLHYAIFLSYPDPPMVERTTTLPEWLGNPTQYGKGPKDFAFVAFYTIVFSFTREFLMQRLIRPIALRCGIRKRGKQNRFMEQFYTAIYFAVFGPFGLWVMSRTPVWYFNIPGMYEGFPHRAHEAGFKAYYLLQAAYWTQQSLVMLLQLEAPRKDYYELVLHHMVTLALIGLSYRFHFTYMGIAVYLTHDISDFFLATSKVLNYLEHPLTIPYFACFMFIWGYLRHFVNLRIIYSLFPFSLGFGTPNQFATVGPYELNWETQQYKCWIAHIITFSLLAILQSVNLFWFYLIMRILVRYFKTGDEKDPRSEDEAEPEEEEGASELKEKREVRGLNGHVNGGAVKPEIMLNGQSHDVEDRKSTLRQR